jgi:hypothetical protein
LRAAFNHHLQVSDEALMRAIRIAGQSSLHQSPTNHFGHPVNQGVMHNAVRYVHDPVGSEFKQPDLWRAQPATDGKARPEAKSRSLPGDHPYLGHTMNVGQFIDGAACREGDPWFTESGARRARRSMRAIF